MNVYLDLNNLEKESEQYNGIGLILNYTYLVEELSKGYSVNKMCFFDSNPSKKITPYNDGLRRIHGILENAGFEAHLYRPLYYADGKDTDPRQKEVDTAFCCMAVRDAIKDEFDTALFLTGDRDMCPAVENIHGEGKRVIVAAFEHQFAECLRDCADEYHFIEDLNCMQVVSDFGDMRRMNTAVAAGGE